MVLEVRYLAAVVDAESLDAAWRGVVGLAEDIGIGAIVETRYRRIDENAARLELVRFHLDSNLPPARHRFPVARPRGHGTADQTGSEPPANVAALLDFAPTDLPLRAINGVEGPDPFAAHLAKIFRINHELKLIPVFSLPLTPATEDIAAEFLTFFAERTLTPETTSLLGAVAGTYAGKATVLAAQESGGTRVELLPAEIECIRWAVAGKSLQDIADITGLSHRGVRYRIDQARERYGYATNLQTYVRAAVDYGLEPMPPPNPDRTENGSGSSGPPGNS